jgi:nitroreductase
MRINTIDDLLAVMKERRSVRAFSLSPVSDEEIRILLEAVQCAPSNSNRQAWKFLCIKNNGVKQKMADAVEKKLTQIGAALTDPELIAAFDSYATYMTFFKHAPLVIVALSKHVPSFLEKISREIGVEIANPAIQPELMSVSMAIQNLQLAAHALGLGTCCMTGPLLAADEIRAILDVRTPFELAAIIPVGRYDAAPFAPARKDITLISEIIE